MKTLKLLLIFGWFFALQSPWEGDTKSGTVLTQVIGPFRTEAECKEAFDDVRETMKSLGIEARFQKCNFKRET